MHFGPVWAPVWVHTPALASRPHSPASPAPHFLASLSPLARYVRIFQILLMSFVVATCYINVGKKTLDDGGSALGWVVRRWRLRGGWTDAALHGDSCRYFL